MAERLYCESCAENTIAYTSLVNNPPRTAPCDECFERLIAVFQGTPHAVLHRMLQLQLAVVTHERGIDLTDLGQWAWLDVWHDDRTPEDVRRTMLAVLVHWGTTELIRDMEEPVIEYVGRRSRRYGPEVRLAMDYAGELAPPVEPEKETA